MYAPNPTPVNASGSRQAVPKMVYWIGLTSLLTDISSEMVAAILPVFMFSVLQLSALQIGFLDGLYQGGAALVRVAFGYWADKHQSAKAVAVLGYALSLLGKVLLIISAAGGLLFILLSLLVDRIGKGIRTAPRDALIAQHAPKAHLGAAFGVHRSMDAAGALIGPFIALGFLTLYTNEYQALFAISAVCAVLGLIVICLKVTQPKGQVQTPPQPQQLAAGADSVLAEPLTIGMSVRLLLRNKTYLKTLCLASLLSVFTISDGLFYLNVQQQAQLPGATVTALFAGTATVFMLTAAFLGRVSDAWLPMRLFIVSYVLLLGLYVLWIAGAHFLPSTLQTVGNGDGLSTLQMGLVLGIVVLMGLFYGANEGILMASLVRQLPASVLTTGLALFTTVQGLVKIASSSLYGWLWHSFGMLTATTVFSVCLAICIVLALWFYKKPIELQSTT